jgi:hypothetical protein
MLANRKTLVAGVETEFLFTEFQSHFVTVKNETAGAILFCDGIFDADEAASIPAFSWQAFNIVVLIGDTPKFTVKADVAGAVEIDFGSPGMGALYYPALDVAGMIPHTLAFTAGSDTTLAATLVRQHGDTLDLDVPVVLASGATVFSGDVILFEAAPTDEYCVAALKINGTYVPVIGGETTYTISGDAVAESEAVPLEYELTLTVGDDTTLTADLIRERGASEDLAEPEELLDGAIIYGGSIVGFTATCTAVDHHVVLTVNDAEQVLTEDSVDYEVAGDTTAVTASAAD